MTTVAKEIADMTLQQMGGANRLVAMVNAKNFTYDSQGTLTFKFTGSKKANVVKVELTLMDTYTVKFFKLRGLDVKEVGEFENVYCDQLKGIFENFTGLYLSL